MSLSDSDIETLLDAVEQRELNSLRWGYVDGSLSEAELWAIATTVLGEHQTAAADVVEELVQRMLLSESRRPDGMYQYRSRFAEAVRLLRSLRLLVPTRPWVSAPNLVSDYRVDARPRRVPRRDTVADEAIAALDLEKSPGLRKLLASALLHEGETPLRLAAFQIRATREILRSPATSRGVVISAGTGSGKTLAFYLPALLEIGTWVDSKTHWVKAVALYPRVELLKDQFSEAFRLARKLDAPLTKAGRRPITIGSFFSLTPNMASVDSLKRASWRAAGRSGFVCPFLTCPQCGKELIWRQTDLAAGMERLLCIDMPRCTGEVSGQLVALTRQRAMERPPDILFTTAESLNQRLCDTQRRALFGVHPEPEKRVRLVLLDEIHTYSGSSGAQTALVLRRWRHAIGRPLRIVGLSATLREAPEFLAQLTGLLPNFVTEVSPGEEELDRVSAEYQLILRGDPVSQTSLLSTSIQTAYLLGRILDPQPTQVDARPVGKSEGRFGGRGFVFTDDLDVVNRLFDDLRDAEGYDIFGNPAPDRAPLASLRSSTQPDAPERDVVGQLWRLCEQVGRTPTQRLRISRTSSQDAGVSATSDVVVATSALEVGFDDPLVGAVLQHKAPRELAAFMQRKGRAGRTVRMRPWMVTVLSDYGRDRLAYQAYDQLFDPVLPPQRLPIRNQYILRMQAVFSFIDWLAEHVSAPGARDWWWSILNGPSSGQWQQRQQVAALKTIRSLLRGDDGLRERLATHLGKALQISYEEVQSLLWEPPRSLLLDVLPTLDRRIATNWAVSQSGESGPTTDLMATPPAVHPLPDFVPANLFSDLSLPEVEVLVPPAQHGAEERRELLPILHAMQQLAPGRVTRRFAFERGGLSHWIPVPEDAAIFEMRVNEFAERYEYVTQVSVVHDDRVQLLPCFRPWTVRVQRTPKSIATTSNAFLDWATQLLPIGEAVSLPIARGWGWEDIIQSANFHLHRFRSPVTVRRFATGAVATLRLTGSGEERKIQTQFADEHGQPAVMGFEQEVDGICVRLRLPDAASMAARAAHSSELPTWRTAYFRDRILHDRVLAAQANVFQGDWLYQIYLSALVTRATEGNVSLAQAHTALHDGDPLTAFRQVMSGIFQILSETDDPDGEGEDASNAKENSGGRLQQRLTDLLRTPLVLERLKALAPELWAPDPVEWGNWLRRRAYETLGEALLMACMYIVPKEAGADTLLMDLDRGPAQEYDHHDSEEEEIWITESTLGGAGVVEAIAEAIAENPGVLPRALEAALAPSVGELTSSNLDRFAELVVRDAEVAEETQRVREQHDHAQRDAQRARLYRTLAQRGLGVDHAFSVALNYRLLRPGTDASGNYLVADLLATWREAETRLGIALDLRVFCYLAAIDPTLQPRMREWIAGSTGSHYTVLSLADIVGVTSGILWPRAAEMRAHIFDGYTPYHKRGFTDPTLVRELFIATHIAEVQLGDPEWIEQLHTELACRGSVRLAAARQQELLLREHLARLVAMPVNVDYLQFFPTVERVTRNEVGTSVTLVLRELV